MADNGRLRRVLSLPTLTLYGLGTMVGGGFYALVGKVAGEAGTLAPLAFLVSALVALLSALSYAELASRFPVSAGEARYIREGLGRAWLARAAGWGVALTGVVSAATLSVAFSGFLRDLTGAPPIVGRVGVVALLVLVAAWGMAQSAALTIVITVIEVGTLMVIVGASSGSLASLPERADELFVPHSLAAALGVGSGAFLAFYSFIGFEDMVNEAEEVRRPRRTLPLALVLALVLTTALYMLVSVAAALSVEPGELAASDTPLATVARRVGLGGAGVITVVSMLAGVNGALVQIVMSSRVLYGMARQGDAPAPLARVHPRSRTPLTATLIVGGVVLALSLVLGLVALAKITSAIILVVFILVNVSLVALKCRASAGDEPPAFRVPVAVPLLGGAVCAVMLALELWRQLG